MAIPIRKATARSDARRRGRRAAAATVLVFPEMKPATPDPPGSDAPLADRLRWIELVLPHHATLIESTIEHVINKYLAGGHGDDEYVSSQFTPRPRAKQ